MERIVRVVYAALFTGRRLGKRYVRAACAVADETIHDYPSSEAHFHWLCSEWVFWEQLYAQRGYRIFPLDLFINYQMMKERIVALGTKRDAGEGVVYHAARFARAAHPHAHEQPLFL